MLNPEKILVAGDWHGDWPAAHYAMNRARNEGCDVVVQCGDFGFLPHVHPNYSYRVSEDARRTGVHVVWVDGNHENFDVLFRAEWPPTEEGFWRLADRVLYAPRGHRWIWQDVRFLALGGGYSVDKKYRLAKERCPRTLWWHEETLTQSDMYRAVEGGETDILITHDVPAGVAGRKALFRITGDAQNRMAVRFVVDRTRPSRVYHGHWHKRKDRLLHLKDGWPVEVVGLGMNGDYDRNFVVVDLIEFKRASLPDGKPGSRRRKRFVA